MSPNPALTAANKLTVLFRVEPGSLGPDGKVLAQSFCDRTQQHLTSLGIGPVEWQILPRFDKSLPELEYKVSNKRLSRAQAKQYLALLGLDIDAIEDQLIGEIDLQIGNAQAG